MQLGGRLFLAEIADCLLFPVELAPLLPELAMFSSVNLPRPKAENNLQAIFENIASQALCSTCTMVCISMVGGT